MLAPEPCCGFPNFFIESHVFLSSNVVCSAGPNLPSDNGPGAVTASSAGLDCNW